MKDYKEQKNSCCYLSPAITRFPSPIKEIVMKRTNEEKKTLIAEHFRQIMEILDLDLENESISETPNRVARMYVDEVFSGLDESTFPSVSLFDHIADQSDSDQMVFEKVSFSSFCEHHFVPMNGYVYLAYIPKTKVIGLSKIPRVVRFFAKRPQLQERLTSQVADCFSTLLELEDIAVSVSAYHYCVMARGIEDCSSHTITNDLRGKFRENDQLRREFFEAINRPSPLR